MENFDTLRIGLLYSTTGTTAVVEAGQLRASLLAIEEVNATGKLHFEAIVEDIRSDPDMAARMAARLLREKRVDVLVGCWTSACRKAVLPVLDDTGGLLLYTTNYEGQECHPNVFYLGAVPNQQVDSMLSWVVGNLASRFILIGSDYIYPQLTNRQVRHWLERVDGNMSLIERFFPLGFVEFGSFLREIRPIINGPAPVVVFSTLVGSSVAAFYQQFRQAGFHVPIVSPITSECEIAAMGSSAAAGHYCTSGYFQTLDTEANRRFVEAYRRRFGDGPVNGSMEFAYNAIHMLEMACRRLLREMPGVRPGPEQLREALSHLCFEAPEGPLLVDPHTRHLWLWSRIGRVQPDGRMEIVWSSPGPIPPHPYGEGFKPQPLAAAPPPASERFGSLIGSAPLFLEKMRIARIAARTRASVIITGESGTGKELCARAIHAASDRREGPFLPINCAAIPRELIGSELFGYEEGSFTGAKKGGRRGKFELVSGGTLFLDEIGEMPLELQGHLLRVLQEGEVYRIGGKEPIPVDVRIIAATNRDLVQEIAFKGTFRSDLYYRLNVFNIDLPSLRERPGDILPLAEYFLHHLNHRNDTAKDLDQRTRQFLMAHPWPGNVRELSNTVERAYYVSLDSPLVLPEHLPEAIFSAREPAGWASVPDAPDDPIRDPATKGSFDLREQERELIARAIRDADYNLSRAALALGVSRSTLYRKMSRHGVNLTPTLQTDPDAGRCDG